MSDSAAGSEKGFWHTAPGLITAIAALVTAVGGVLGILIQNDIIGRDEPSTTVATADEGATAGDGAADPTQTTPDESPAAAQTSDGNGLVPWAEADATLERRDGTSSTVRAATVHIACATGKLTFENGQTIDLDRVRSLEFETIYPASADGVVTLLDGQVLDDPIDTRNCPVGGTNDLGRVDVPLADIARIEFIR